MADFWQWDGDPTTGSGYIQNRGSYAVNNTTIITATITWTSGTTATSSQTVTVSALGTTTTVAHEIFITNDGPYEVTADVYKTISANGTYNTNISTTLAIPATADTAGITVAAKGIEVQGLFNVNLGLTIRLTVTAAFTATITNYVLIKELDL